MTGEANKHIMTIVCWLICLVLTTNAIDQDCNCWENIVFRQPCPFGGMIDKTSCHNAGCCYDNNATTVYGIPHSPFCYIKKGTCPKREKCIVYGEREVCGHRALDRTPCEFRGCCFDNSRYPFCYRPKPATTTTSQVWTPSTTSAKTQTLTPVATTSFTYFSTPSTPSTPTATKETTRATTTQTQRASSTVTSKDTTSQSSTFKSTTRYSTETSTSESTTYMPTSMPLIPIRTTGFNKLTKTSSISTETMSTITKQAVTSDPSTTAPSEPPKPTTTAVPYSYQGGPFGFFQLGTILIYSQCPEYGRNACLVNGTIITDRLNCTLNYCCWNGALTSLPLYDACYQPSIHLINLPTATTTASGGNTNGSSFSTVSPTPPSWGNWGSWGECEGDPCVDGKRVRKRECKNAKAGFGCFGDDTQSVLCEWKCQRTWSTWSVWSLCDATCSAGYKQRVRVCIEQGTVQNSTDCPGGDLNSREKESCNEDYCSMWSPWITQPCSSSCGEGIRNNTRICYGEEENKSPPECYYVTEKCNDSPCLVPQASVVEWAPWTPWSRCSDPCGAGVRSRVRLCYNQFSGQALDQDSRNYCGTDPMEGLDISDCNKDICSSWSTWSSISRCSASCDEKQTRYCVGNSTAPPPFACLKRTTRCSNSTNVC